MHDLKYYEDIGFMCGLEVHQRLATKEKLFCSCFAAISQEQSIGKIERKQRAVAGEMGNVDKAAQFESNKGRKFVYNVFRNSTCLVDIDEEPPHSINYDALEAALLFSITLNASIPSEIQPMRKEVVDGSDPSAFQRTMLVGYNGFIEINKRKIKIPGIFLEEESSGIEDSDSESVIYNVDRLGIPLVEIDTDPDIRTPNEAKECALRIGTLFRLTGKVQRGIGSIRQDVNVSIKNGARVEIKGFQDLEMMTEIIDSEIERQIKLAEIVRELRSRSAKVHNAKDVSWVFANTNIELIKGKENLRVYAARLEGFKGMLGREINPNRRLGSEISDYAKLAGVRGILHSDEKLEKYNFSMEEIKSLSDELELKENDGFILIAADLETCKRAMEVALYRSQLAIERVPEETRLADSKLKTTRFLRPLPGGARMYPETDLEPITIDHSKNLKLLYMIPDIEKKTAELTLQIGNSQLAEQMLKSQKLPLYEAIVKKTKAKPIVVASMLLEKMKEIKRNGIDADAIDEDAIMYIFDLFKKEEITRAGIEEILKAVPKKEDIEEIIRKKHLRRMSSKMLKEIISSSKEKDKDKLIKEIMSKYRLNIDGEELNSLVR